MEREIQQLSLLVRQLSTRHINQLASRIWRYKLNEQFSSNEASADLIALDGTDTLLDVIVRDPLGVMASALVDDEGMCAEQLDVDGERWFIVLAGGAGTNWYIGMTTEAIASETTGEVEQHDQLWEPTGVTFEVLNPHEVELPQDLKVRWTRYPGWDDWVVEPFDYTEC
jgi:hypothetical protein